MDRRLFDRLKKIEEQIDVLRDVEYNYLTLEAHEKVLFAKIYSNISRGSIEDRKQAVYSDQAWINFSRGLAASQSEYLEQKRRYELKIKAYDAEHLTYKNELPAIKRQNG